MKNFLKICFFNDKYEYHDSLCNPVWLQEIGIDLFEKVIKLYEYNQDIYYQLPCLFNNDKYFNDEYYQWVKGNDKKLEIGYICVHYGVYYSGSSNRNSDGDKYVKIGINILDKRMREDTSDRNPILDSVEFLSFYSYVCILFGVNRMAKKSVIYGSGAVSFQGNVENMENYILKYLKVGIYHFKKNFLIFKRKYDKMKMVWEGFRLRFIDSCNFICDYSIRNGKPNIVRKYLGYCHQMINDSTDIKNMEMNNTRVTHLMYYGQYILTLQNQFDKALEKFNETKKIDYNNPMLKKWIEEMIEMCNSSSNYVQNQREKMLQKIPQLREMDKRGGLSIRLRGSFISPGFESTEVKNKSYYKVLKEMERIDKEVKCNYCQQKEEFIQRMQKCSRCKTTYYCSVKCQKKDWKSHKMVCKVPQARQRIRKCIKRKE